MGKLSNHSDPSPWPSSNEMVPYWWDQSISGPYKWLAQEEVRGMPSQRKLWYPQWYLQHCTEATLAASSRSGYSDTTVGRGAEHGFIRHAAPASQRWMISWAGRCLDSVYCAVVFIWIRRSVTYITRNQSNKLITRFPPKILFHSLIIDDFNFLGRWYSMLLC